MKPIAWPVAPLGLTNRASRVRITALAVPVRNSLPTQLAFSAIPASLIQFAATKVLAVRKIILIDPNTTIFLSVKLVICPFPEG